MDVAVPLGSVVESLVPILRVEQAVVVVAVPVFVVPEGVQMVEPGFRLPHLAAMLFGLLPTLVSNSQGDLQLADGVVAELVDLAVILVDIQPVRQEDIGQEAVDTEGNLDSVRRSVHSPLEVEHFVGTYFVGRTFDCLVVVGMRLADVTMVAFHDKLEEQHLRTPVDHMAALLVDSCFDSLDLAEAVHSHSAHAAVAADIHGMLVVGLVAVPVVDQGVLVLGDLVLGAAVKVAVMAA